MKFSVHYFDLPLTSSCKSDYREVDINEFWKNAESAVQGIQKGLGIYVFGRKYGNSYTPFYVGKTTNSFGAELFQDHKLRKFEKCAREEKGTLCIVLVVARTDKGKISQHKNKEAINWLETLFIGYAYQRQQDKLYNSKKLRFLREISIPDVLNSAKGASDKNSRILKNMLFGVSLTKNKKQ